MDKDPEGLANKRLLGDRVTNQKMATHIAKLYYGDMTNGTAQRTQSEIAETLGYKDTKSIKDYLNLAKKLGIKEDKKNDYKLTDYKFLQNMDEFVSIPSVKIWVDDMKTRATGGKAFGGMKKHLTIVKNVCDTLEISPVQLINGGDLQTVLKNGESYMNQFMDLYMQKKAKINYNKNWDASRVQKITTQYMYAQSVRDFMRILGYAYPKGKGGVMSQTVTPFHGKYADVRMTKLQYREGKKFIKEKWGHDSDIFRWFSFGIEAFPRKSAILSARANYEKVTYLKKEYYSMEVIETKTSQYKGGKWKKLIYDDDTKQSIDFVKNRNSEYIIETHRTENQIRKEIYPKLLEVFRFLELTHHARRIADDETTSYFIAKPSHALRHCGTQIWLFATKWNTKYVSGMGWKDESELSNSYGEMPEELKMEVAGGADLD